MVWLWICKFHLLYKDLDEWEWKLINTRYIYIILRKRCCSHTSLFCNDCNDWALLNSNLYKGAWSTHDFSTLINLLFIFLTWWKITVRASYKYTMVTGSLLKMSSWSNCKSKYLTYLEIHGQIREKLSSEKSFLPVVWSACALPKINLLRLLEWMCVCVREVTLIWLRFS